MVSIHNFDNTGRKLKSDHHICCIYVFIEEAGIFSMNDSGEKGYKFTEHFFFNSLALFSLLRRNCFPQDFVMGSQMD